jgi:hypothetical protein
MTIAKRRVAAVSQTIPIITSAGKSARVGLTLLCRAMGSFEAPGVEPVFLNQEHAIDYTKNRACFRSGEIRVPDSRGDVERTIPFT